MESESKNWFQHRVRFGLFLQHHLCTLLPHVGFRLQFYAGYPGSHCEQSPVGSSTINRASVSDLVCRHSSPHQFSSRITMLGLREGTWRSSRERDEGMPRMMLLKREEISTGPAGSHWPIQERIQGERGKGSPREEEPELFRSLSSVWAVLTCGAGIYKCPRCWQWSAARDSRHPPRNTGWGKAQRQTPAKETHQPSVHLTWVLTGPQAKKWAAVCCQRCCSGCQGSVCGLGGGLAWGRCWPWEGQGQLGFSENQGEGSQMVLRGRGDGMRA